jgi:hypothetical protein
LSVVGLRLVERASSFAPSIGWRSAASRSSACERFEIVGDLALHRLLADVVQQRRDAEVRQRAAIQIQEVTDRDRDAADVDRVRVRVLVSLAERREPDDDRLRQRDAFDERLDDALRVPHLERRLERRRHEQQSRALDRLRLAAAAGDLERLDARLVELHLRELLLGRRRSVAPGVPEGSIEAWRITVVPWIAAASAAVSNSRPVGPSTARNSANSRPSSDGATPSSKRMPEMARRVNSSITVFWNTKLDLLTGMRTPFRYRSESCATSTASPDCWRIGRTVSSRFSSWPRNT